MERYKKIAKIGEGAYGVVYKAMHMATNRIVAMKKLKLESEGEGIPATTIREISLLRELRHPNIVTMEDAIMTDDKIYIIFEFLDMDLRRYMDLLPADQSMAPTVVKSFLYQITSAMLFCHMRRVFHRDLKPQNLLVNKFGVIKVGDFGLARTFNVPARKYTEIVVTLWYRAPEILLGAICYSFPIDIWSIGCIFAEMTTRKALFRGDSEIDQLFKIFRILKTPTEEIWKGVTKLEDYKPTFPLWKEYLLESQVKGMDDKALDLLKKTLIYDPNNRISAKKMLEHEYFNDFKNELVPLTF